MIRGCERGTVMIETLLAFMPVFTLFLGIVQYVLLAIAQLVVHHAAVAGVRAASVALDDDPQFHAGAERLSLADGSCDATSDPLAALAGVLLSDVPSDTNGAAPRSSGVCGARVAPVRNAVYAKLAAIVPARADAALEGKPSPSVLEGLGTEPARRLLQARRYLPAATTIEFPRTPGSDELLEDRVEPGQLLTVRVTHITSCTVPLVNVLMCSELKKELRAEASMPLQSAPYSYASKPTEREP
jgi:hypothetical protein